MLETLSHILRTDGYKPSQWKQYPPNTEYVNSYIESRSITGKTVFFGLQAFIKEYLTKPVTMQDVVFAEQVFKKYGVPFNREGWEIIVNEYDGKLPLKIEAVPEGTVMASHNVQVQVVNTDPRLYWLTSYIETALLRGVWYPSTVATESRNFKVQLMKALHKTSDIPDEDLLNTVVKFSLHDFGARGASSTESAILGGMSHLVNFWGSDTIEGIVGTAVYYDADITNPDEAPTAFSIPASEHSTMTAWGQENEADAYENMIKQFSKPGTIYACVSDSYDIYSATRNIWGEELRQKVIDSGGTLVVRPDSGDVLTVPIEVLDILAEQFGYTVNKKGYKVLAQREDGSPIVKVIQGDGLNSRTFPVLINNIVNAGYSLENIAFGMGGGLLQDVSRNTLNYAMKASSIMGSDGVWRDVAKDPITDTGKRSKKGRLALVYECGIGSCGYRTIPEQFVAKKKNELRTVFLNGELVEEQDFEDIKSRAELEEVEYKPSYSSRYEDDDLMSVRQVASVWKKNHEKMQA